MAALAVRGRVDFHNLEHPPRSWRVPAGAAKGRVDALDSPIRMLEDLVLPDATHPPAQLF